VHHRGTFDTWKSYAIFLSSPTDPNYASWTFVGNASDVVAGPDAPLAAYEQGAPTDPSTIDTGYAHLNITGLQAVSDYYVMVRANFEFGSNHAGYGGGLGSYTTYISSGKFYIGRIPEFTTILVPVLATLGIFLIATHVHRKKD